ncbi:MAG: hypothetical protein CL609_21825 [Anaerolineaceae bacterium]|nr:hypothetical protein [Anaerolineaceae bacterium]
MLIRDIFIFAALAVLFRLISRGKARGWLLLITSTLVIYWMQPAMPLRSLDFWLPTLTLAITVFSWLLTAEEEQKTEKQNWLTAVLLVGLVILIALTRYLSLDGLITANRPPLTVQVLVGLVILAAVGFVIGWFSRQKAWLTGGIIFLLVLFLILKSPALSLWSSVGLRSMLGQSTQNATAFDIRWLGFSYVAFRLIHTIRDRQNNRLKAVTLQEYVNYVIFFPAFSAGPIDKLPRFAKDLREPLVFYNPQLADAFYRLVVGIFKKYAIADSLSLIALNSQNAAQTQGAGYTWVLVYAYAFMIYYDFAGYTDIAIGLGKLLGIDLPENFNRPYMKNNLTQFWNNWHMTLTQWFRAYFFNPFTRSLRTRYKNLSVGWVILITQVSTMVLIGLWHGITWNFVLWGLWHGLGLFVQNRFSDWVKPRLAQLQDKPRLQNFLNGFNTVLTFHFVALGWVWFALPQVGLSWQVILSSLGLAG